MEKDASTRMGAPNSPHEDIAEADFFYDIDWRRLEKRQLPPPFKPQVVSVVVVVVVVVARRRCPKPNFDPVSFGRNTRWTRSTSIGRSRANASA